MMLVSLLLLVCGVHVCKARFLLQNSPCTNCATDAQDKATNAKRILSEDEPMYKLVAGFFDEWNQRVQEGGAAKQGNEFGDGSKVAELYAPSGTLLATLSDEIRTGRTAIQDYFDASATLQKEEQDRFASSIRSWFQDLFDVSPTQADKPAAFTSFLAKNPVGRIVERTIQAVGTGLAIDEGLYIFEVDDGEGGRVDALARYTYTYKKMEDNKWYIMVHHSSQQPQYQAEEGLVRQHLDRWFKSLRTTVKVDQGDPSGTCVDVSDKACVHDPEVKAQGIADLYAEDAVFLATVSPKLRVGRNDVVDYMRYFGALDPVGEIVEDAAGNGPVIKILGPTTTAIVGHYKFTYPATADPFARAEVYARFSFTYTRSPSGKWLISEHHSSALPEGDERNGKSIADPLDPSMVQHKIHF